MVEDYQPHFSVLKDNIPANLRLVVDVSSKTSKEVSPNEKFMVGSKTKPILILNPFRFRSKHLTMTSDLEKMCRQIRIAEQDNIYQRILWRAHPDHHVKEYRLLAVTYGICSALFPVSKTLQKSADYGQDQFLCKDIKMDFYVNDLLSGANDIGNVLSLQLYLMFINWTSNYQKLNKRAQQKQRSTVEVLVETTSITSEFLIKNSSFQYLLEVTVYCKGIRDSDSLEKENRLIGFISSAEFIDVTKSFIKNSQNNKEAEEIGYCRDRKLLMTRLTINSLHPSLNSEDIQRVGGRLENSTSSSSANHLIILSKLSIFYELLISNFHLRYYLDAGSTQCCAFARIQWKTSSKLLS